MRYMIDTETCIEAMRGNMRVIREWTQHEPEEICISMLTYAELCSGIGQGSQAKLEKFLEEVKIVEFGAEAAREYGKLKHFLRRQGMTGEVEMMIAAQANSLDLTLVTRKVQEFAQVPGLEVADWT